MEAQSTLLARSVAAWRVWVGPLLGADLLARSSRGFARSDVRCNARVLSAAQSKAS
jgi:hypothetical protein